MSSRSASVVALVASLIMSAVFAPAVTLLPAQARATVPCVTPTTPCERWLTYGAGPARSMVYATHPLATRNTTVTRALIMIHGASRNADHYFATATAAGFLAGALDNTVIIAPHIIAGTDKPQANEVLWPSSGINWRSGGFASSDPTITSFDFIDELVRKLADKRIFPNLTKIVIAGHSAGGQVVTRYEMANKVHNTAGVSITYVVANPSSYAWPASVRPLPTGDANPLDAYKESLGDDGEKVHANFSYGAFDSTKAPTFDRWPAGLQELSGYTANMSADQLRKQLVERQVTYLWGQVDVLPLGGFDSSPSAMAQGPTRRARGEAFFKYVNDTMGAKHSALIVPECGHNDRCIFTTDIVFPVIFPN
ncbi:MAG: alpha/beta fold hydrolase [Gemmatimonadaceae bacterium]